MKDRLFDLAPLEPYIAEGRLILTPNSRLARRLRGVWDARQAAAGARAWEPLPAYPLEAWLLQQWRRASGLGLLAPRLLLDGMQEHQVWQQVIADSRQSAQLMLPAAAAELASAARDSLLRWCIDVDEPGVRQQFQLEADCASFRDWLAEFDRRLSAAGQCTAAEAIGELVRVPGGLENPGAVILCGGDEAPLLQRALAGVVPDVAHCELPARCSSQHLYAFPEPRTELAAVAAWAADLHRADPDCTIGIVLAGASRQRVSLEYLLRREFDCLGDNYNSLPVNFSAGIGLDLAPVVRDALAALATTGESIDVEQVKALLASRFLHLPDGDSAAAMQLVTRLHRDGNRRVSMSDLRYAASDAVLEEGLVLGARLLQVYQLPFRRRRLAPSAWAAHFAEVLTLWGWPGTALDSLEYQQVERWHQTLEHFRCLDAVCTGLSYDGALGMLREACRGRVSHPQTADSPLQVLGPLEAVGLHFDHLWVVGMQASTWPPPARPNPLLPLALQVQRNMPHASSAREWDFAEGLLRHYRAGARELHASYSQMVDGVGELPSPLLAGPGAVNSVSPGGTGGWRAAWRAGLAQALDDSLAPPLDPGSTPVSGGAALLKDQANCPFSAFAKRRLAVQALEDFGVGLSAAERGTLVHDALDHLWGQLATRSALLALDAQGETALCEAAAEAAISRVAERRRRTLGPGFWELERRRLASLLGEWLQVEKERECFSVVERELRLPCTIAGLQLELRVDRIDQLADGSRVIIDYKTGTCRVASWLGERPEEPQLPLYSVAAAGGDALAFAQVRPGEAAYIGLGRAAAAPGVSTDIERAVARSDSAGADDWQSLNTLWQQRLTALVREFLEGAAAVRPLTRNSCTWCGLQPFCRIEHDRAEDKA